jgi:ABC-type glycerol-3-phosphate transport system permease component
MVTSPRSKILSGIATAIGVTILVVWSLGPIYWVVVTSLKTAKEIYAFPPTLYPVVATLANYRDALLKWNFGHFIYNSAVVAVTVTLLSIVIGALAAYPIARLRFPGRALAARSIIVSYLLPPSLLFIPLFIVLSRLGLIDSKLGLVVAYLTFTVPFCTWLLIGYFRTIPVELDEAALIDGASRIQILKRVVLPIALPGISVVALYAFTNSWNEFLYALVYVSSADAKTFTAGLTGLVMGDTFIWGQLMASSVIAILPVLVIYLIAQRYLVEGLAAGSVKT